MASRNSPVTLVDPVTGAERRCASKARYAVAVLWPAEGTRPAELAVLFRTSNVDVLHKKGAVEARRRNRNLRAYDLSDGTLIGMFPPSTGHTFRPLDPPL